MSSRAYTVPATDTTTRAPVLYHIQQAPNTQTSAVLQRALTPSAASSNGTVQQNNDIAYTNGNGTTNGTMSTDNGVGTFPNGLAPTNGSTSSNGIAVAPDYGPMIPPNGIPGPPGMIPFPNGTVTTNGTTATDGSVLASDYGSVSFDNLQIPSNASVPSAPSTASLVSSRSRTLPTNGDVSATSTSLNASGNVLRKRLQTLQQLRAELLVISTETANALQTVTKEQEELSKIKACNGGYCV